MYTLVISAATLNTLFCFKTKRLNYVNMYFGNGDERFFLLSRSQDLIKGGIRGFNLTAKKYFT